MAINAVKLTDKECELFHINYEYMWKKLNTAPYYVSGAGERPNWIRGCDTLPSYVNLSKCRKADFVPTTTIVNKIVNFYNENIEPSITTYQFTKEDLSLTDSARRPAASKLDTRFIGTYFGYYYSESEKKTVVGSIIKIFEENQTLRANIITGIMNENMLYSSDLQKLVSKSYISSSAYTKYKNNLDISLRRTTFYEGNVIVTNKFLIIQAQGIDRNQKSIALTTRIEGFTENQEYLSGISYATLISDSFDIQFFKMAITRAYKNDLVPINFNNEKLIEILDIQKGKNERIILTPRDEHAWYELVIENGK